MACSTLKIHAKKKSVAFALSCFQSGIPLGDFYIEEVDHVDGDEPEVRVEFNYVDDDRALWHNDSELVDSHASLSSIENHTWDDTADDVETIVCTSNWKDTDSYKIMI